MRIWVAIRAFFAVLFSRAAAERVRQALDQWAQQRRHAGAGSAQSEPSPSLTATSEAAPGAALLQQPGPAPGRPATKPTAKAPPKPMGPTRSEALTLLAALQREARLVDLILEPLDQYTDAQIGAAAREVLRNTAKTLDRFFGLRPVLQAEEGAVVEVPRGFDPNRYRLVGQVAGQPPHRGQLIHPGWQASRCELPTWTGSEEAAWIIAPAEIDIQSS